MKKAVGLTFLPFFFFDQSCKTNTFLCIYGHKALIDEFEPTNRSARASKTQSRLIRCNQAVLLSSANNKLRFAHGSLCIQIRSLTFICGGHSLQIGLTVFSDIPICAAIFLYPSPFSLRLAIICFSWVVIEQSSNRLIV